MPGDRQYVAGTGCRHIEQRALPQQGIGLVLGAAVIVLQRAWNRAFLNVEQQDVRELQTLRPVHRHHQGLAGPGVLAVDGTDVDAALVEAVDDGVASILVPHEHRDRLWRRRAPGLDLVVARQPRSDQRGGLVELVARSRGVHHHGHGSASRGAVLVLLRLALEVDEFAAGEDAHGPVQVLGGGAVVEGQASRSPADVDAVLGQRQLVPVDPHAERLLSKHLLECSISCMGESVQVVEGHVWEALSTRDFRRGNRRNLAEELHVPIREVRTSLKSRKWSRLRFRNTSMVLPGEERALSDIQPVQLPHPTGTNWLYKNVVYSCDPALRPFDVKGRIESLTQSTHANATSVGSISLEGSREKNADPRGRTAAKIRRLLFPSAIPITTLAAFMVWMAGAIYLDSFYGYFTLRPDELGITYVTILERSLPIIISLGIAVSLTIFFSAVLPGSAKRLTRWIESHRPQLNIRTVLGLALVVLSGASLGVRALDQAGARDADRMSSMDVADYYVGGLQRIYGPPLVVAYISWTGDPKNSPLPEITPQRESDGSVVRDKSTSQIWNLARQIGRNGEVTYILSLADCQVYRVPTASITLVNPTVQFTGTGSSSIPHCPAQFP